MSNSLHAFDLIHWATGERVAENQLYGYSGPVMPVSVKSKHRGPRTGGWTPWACDDWWISVPVKVTDETRENGAWAATYSNGSTIPAQWCQECYNEYVSEYDE